ncbi:MAG: phosphoenolpyruvate carboxykinase (ATP) [Deltaproteobacteria bacterium]|nr:phosphoenolpyruvate carboxykinase (ATP) [Deltaproteobacteria bacterium]
MALPTALKTYGFTKTPKVSWTLSTEALIQKALEREEGIRSAKGPFVTQTGKHTGRAAQDKYIVREALTEKTIWWDKNASLQPQQFDTLYRDIVHHLEAKELFVQDCFVGADPEHQYSVRVITETAWHSAFARNMFFAKPQGFVHAGTPRFTIFHSPSFQTLPQKHGTRSETCIALDFRKGWVVIGGTAYAGEIKKSVFTLLNYAYPDEGVFPMHSSINVGHSKEDVALFFGLSGTGKTTLSADVERTLIGDDEHGWGPKGTFNFEGGCYAKVIRLSPKNEPEIYATTQRSETILENVVLNLQTKQFDLDDASITENTRASYPIHYIPHADPKGMAGHPKNILMLTCDAFGVLPPVARLSSEQAMYHFISGYTAKVAGTEIGVKEPEATFSTCFGAPFMPRHSSIYAKQLQERMKQHHSRAWLINTGWTGGPYGVGQRMSLPYTRAILKAIFSGKLNEVACEKDPIFGFQIPTACPDVPAAILNPQNTWKDKQSFEKTAQHLALRFVNNFKQFQLKDLEPFGPIITK